MSPEIVTWLWLICGLGLIVVEYFAPHFFSGFLGVAALLVALLRWSGLFTDVAPSFAAWAILSVVLIVTLRQLAIKKLHAESSVQPTDEDLEAHGEVVDVVARISSQDNSGRIRYHGTTWPAISREGIIEPGQKARLLYRDNLNWIVERHPELAERSSHPVAEKEQD